MTNIEEYIYKKKKRKKEWDISFLAFPLLKVMMMITINKSITKKQNRARGNEYIDR